MSKHHDPTRRSFLGAAAGIGASLLLYRDSNPHNSALNFENGTVRPMATLRCVLTPGSLPTGKTVHLELLLTGPEFDEPQLIAQHQAVLESEPMVWPVQLTYAHPRLVPGHYQYFASARIDDQQLCSPPLEYILRPFRFGV